MADSRVFVLENVDKYAVSIPVNVAQRFFAILATYDDEPASRVEDVTESEQQQGEELELEMRDLHVSREVLDATMAYALFADCDRTPRIPKPLTGHMSDIVTAAEMAFVERASEGGFLMPLLDFATLLRFDALIALTAAYTSERIDAIARGAPTIMEGAELIRKFLKMPNEWTEDEMVNLTKEMEHAKEVDPNAY